MKQTQSQQQASKQLKLNQWGKIAITIFSDEAIEFGIKQVKKFKTAQNPYSYFTSQAKQYSIKHGIALEWQRCNKLQQEHNMPADIDVFVDHSIVDEPETKFYTHKVDELDYDNECAKWHKMVMGWDEIGDDPKNYALPRRQKKCVKGYELTYPMYKDWLNKMPLTTFLDSNPPDVLLYMDESKLTLLDAMKRS